MKSAMVGSFLFSVVVVGVLSLGTGGCAAEPEEIEEMGDTTSNLSCKRVATEKVIAGRVIKSSRIVCDGSNDKPASNPGTSTCTVNGRKLICEGGGCRAVNGQPGEGCRFADAADEDKDDDKDDDKKDDDGGAKNTPASPGPAGGASACKINGKKAVCDNGGCVAVNGAPGPGCRFVE